MVSFSMIHYYFCIVTFALAIGFLVKMGAVKTEYRKMEDIMQTYRQ